MTSGRGHVSSLLPQPDARHLLGRTGEPTSDTTTQLGGAAKDCADGEVLASLGRLVDESVVMAEEHVGEVRYRLLETIRAFAAARLAEAREDAALRDRHLPWHVAFAGEADAPGVGTTRRCGTVRCSSSAPVAMETHA